LPPQIAVGTIARPKNQIRNVSNYSRKGELGEFRAEILQSKSCLLTEWVGWQYCFRGKCHSF